MENVRRVTPGKSVIWAWWDQGFALTYWGNRATVVDGRSVNELMILCAALPLASPDERFAANFMRFYAAHGPEGINKMTRVLHCGYPEALAVLQNVLGAGPERGATLIGQTFEECRGGANAEAAESWLRYFFPDLGRPLYVFLDLSLAAKAYWWYWIGTWDGGKGEGRHPYYLPFEEVEIAQDWIVGGDGLSIDLNRGVLRAQATNVWLDAVFALTPGGAREKQYERSTGWRFEMIAPAEFGVLMDGEIAESLFNRLFLRHYKASPYFLPVRLCAPSYQLWAVRADTLPRRAPPAK